MKKISLITLCFALLIAIVWWKVDSSNTAFRIGINIGERPTTNSRGIAGEGNHVPRYTLTEKQKELLKEQAIEKYKRNSKDRIMDHTQSFNKEKKN